MKQPDWSPGLGGFRGTRRFEPIRRLGMGGMGEVYEVVDRDKETTVALKLMSELSPDALLRFKNEFRVLQDLRHPNLVCLHELLEEDGMWFFTMELLDGVDLMRWVRPLDEDPADAPTVTETTTARPVTATPKPPRAPGSPRFDEARLRDALGQLGVGLRALHGAGKVHRDIKPSNILINRDGRLVLLDFGLTVDVERNPWLTGTERVIGTPAFMSPEQASGVQVGPQADWYAVGGVLYLALTGRVPFGGNADQMLTAKRQGDPLPPSAHAAPLPKDLEALCLDLLRREPGLRPTGEEVLRRLAVDAGGVLPAEPPSAGRTLFVGRDRELALLETAFLETRHRRAVVVEVHGESGLGKSTLVRRFSERLPLTHGAVVLAGRCYQSEAVPFKAIDGIMDALTAYMATLPADQAAALLPLRASLLAQVFPVLRRVPAIAGAPLPQTDALDPQELRTRVFGALRELLVRLGERRPLVLVIDDLQWTDADSLSLLRAVMRPPEAPPLLLVATVRDVGAGAPRPGLASLAEDVRLLHLEPLPPDESCELAALRLQLLGGDRRVDPAVIAAEGHGNPLFIEELVRHGVAGELRPASPLLLDEVLWARITALGEPASRILELLAVAAMPIAQETLSRATGMDPAEFSRRLAQLRTESLVHLTGARGSDSVQCCHDRVRVAVAAHLDTDQWHRCHRNLALALEAAAHADAEALAQHWYGAGDRERAARYATQAAAQATRALAFDRSVQLYRRAIELQADDGPGRRRLKVDLAGALVNAGHGHEAAETFLAATQGADAAEALDLQRRAAEQFLFSGHFDRGLEVLRAVLDAIDMPMPATPRASLFSLVRSRARLRLRGLRFSERDSSQVAADQLTRVDLCWTVAVAMSMIDHIRGADFQTRSTLLALRAGEPFRVARALGTEMAFSAIEGRRGARRTAKLYARAEALTRRIDEKYTNALFRGSAGVAAFLEGRWKQARDLCDEALVLLDGQVGAVWERNTMELYGALARAYLGEVKEMRRLLALKIDEATRRGDLYAATSLLTGPGPFCWLASDEPQALREQAREALERWSRHGFHVQHFLALFGRTQTDLYLGDAAASLRSIVESWPMMSKAQLLRIQIIRALTDDLRGRAALAEALRAGNDRAALLKTVSRSVHRLRSERMPYTETLAEVLGAGLAAARGETESAARLFAVAEERCVATDMGLHAAVSRRRRGELLADATLVAAADAQMAELGVIRPDRFATMLVALDPQRKP